MLKRLVINNYKVFEHFSMEFGESLNIVVGDNEVGKSTVLEAINLALTKKLNGRQVEYELTPYLFNKKAVATYLASVANGTPLDPPRIEIEMYLTDVPELAAMRGSMNSSKEDSIGVKLEILFNDEYAAEYTTLIRDRAKEVSAVPVEYYTAHWRSFANQEITARALPVRLSYVDATTIRLQSGADYYIQDIIRTSLDPKERVALNIAYRRLKELFSQEDSIKEVNAKLTAQKGTITDKDLALALDISQKASWDATLIPHLDDLPFHLIGKGEQNQLKIMLALERKAGTSDVILVEEPENHLSFSSMNLLLARMQDKCAGKQVVVTTHSAYVLNKLGLGNLILLRNGATVRLKDLSEDTQEYFAKLAGYDTLRLILAKRAILVEGPSDELIVQKAYVDKHGRLPIEDGVDVISVGLSFLRFLEIARGLDIKVAVVTDNDGDAARVDKKFKQYLGVPGITVHRSDDNSARTLEPQLIRANGLNALNTILGRTFASDGDLEAYMTDNKTDCALTLFRSSGLEYPPYILDAVEQQ
jgi:putative ATP-dependent endonuclease of OLD family